MFTNIKEAIANSASLMSPDFVKELLLYTFATNTSYAAVLTQNNQDGDEVQISFMSSKLDEAQLKYLEVDKQECTNFKVVKHFLPYLLKSQTKVIVAYTVVRNLLVQKELGEVHSHWINTLQEYDLKIKPTKIVRGQGLCQMDAEAVVDDGWENETSMYEPKPVQVVDISESWYSILKYYLLIGDILVGLDTQK